MRVIVPDAEKYLRAYCQIGWEEISKLRSLDADGADQVMQCKYHTKMELINVVFRQGHEHKYAYDFETLSFLLRRYRFAQVQRQVCGNSAMNELAIDQPRRAAESLYVEASKQ